MCSESLRDCTCESVAATADAVVLEECLLGSSVLPFTIPTAVHQLLEKHSLQWMMPAADLHPAPRCSSLVLLIIKITCA